MPTALHARLRPIVAIAALYLTTAVLLRLALWQAYGAEGHVGLSEAPYFLVVGIINDLFALTYLAIPLSLYLLLLPEKFLRSTFNRKFLSPIVLFVVLFFLLFLPAAEFLFFDEFDSRFNLVAVDYLMYPTEVIGNIRESYPIVPYLLIIALISLILLKALAPSLQPTFNQPVALKQKWRVLALHITTILSLSYFVSANSLWFSANRVSNEFASNGVSSFFRALATEEIDYNLYYPTVDRAEAYRNLRAYYQSLGEKYASASDIYDLNRIHSAQPHALGKLNVVMLIEESLGAQYVDVYGNNRGLSPNFDRLSQQGLLFKNAYASGTRTVRGLEALSASFPPIPSESIIRRPKSENVANIGSVLRNIGYESLFIYGGFSIFDDMQRYFGGNRFSIVDRFNIRNPKFANIWGVSDEDLLAKSASTFDELAQKGKPFFAMIMTTSNHKPFTFPPGIEGVPESGGGRDAGARYADYAIGKFFEEAKSHSWYSNTLFVVIADHDSRVYGRSYIPIEHYRIPLLMIAPGRLSPRVVESTINQIDVPTTILGLLGIDYVAPFYGVDVLDPRTPSNRPMPVSHNHNVALYQDGAITVLGLDKSVSRYAYGKDGTTQIAEDPESTRQAIAMFQTAYDAFQTEKYRLPASE